MAQSDFIEAADMGALYACVAQMYAERGYAMPLSAAEVAVIRNSLVNLKVQELLDASSRVTDLVSSIAEFNSLALNGNRAITISDLGYAIAYIHHAVRLGFMEALSVEGHEDTYKLTLEGVVALLQAYIPIANDQEADA